LVDLADEEGLEMSTNRGKRALALDPKAAEGLAVRHQIVETADVLVENLRPSVPARLGSTIRRSKPSTRASSIAGYRYGDGGPLS
jgi:crotonobetainyl-CoA:carnitine CoA-transferase CaiB-like acyl-CoA transferase